MPPVPVVGKAAVVAIALVVAAIPLLLLDPSANDGAAPMAATFGIPAIATGVLIEIARPRSGARHFIVGVLPWIGGLVFGLLLLAIPATLLDPRYFAAETVGGMLATLGGLTFVIALGVAFGVLVWVVVVLPIMTLARGFAQAWRGQPVATAGVAGSAIVLGIVAAILIAVAVFGDLDFERLTVVQIVAALLGIPDWYDVSSETGLWIVRVLLVAVAAASAILLVLSRAREADPSRAP